MRRGPWRWMGLAAGLSLVLTACGAEEDAEVIEGEEDVDQVEDDVEAEDDPTPTAEEEEEEAADPFVALCPPDESPDTLVLGIWGGPHEPILEETLSGFTELTGAEVTLTMDSTGDRITRLHAERGTPSIDVAVLPINEIPPLLVEGVIEDLPEDLPNTDRLTEAAHVPGGYGISLFQEVIAYNPDLVTNPPSSWLDLLDEEWQGRIAWPGIPGAPGYATLAMIARAQGGSEEDLSDAIDAVADISDGIVDFPVFGPAFETLVETEEAWIFSQTSGFIQLLIEDGLPVEMVVPEEGAPVLMNVATVPVGVQHEGCSQALVAWLLGDEVQTAYIEMLFYTPATTVDVPGDMADRVTLDPATIVDIDWAVIAENSEDILDEWNRKVLGGG